MDSVTLDKDELAAANINPETGLATDYLNHYNEVAMLVDMLGSMPDMAEEILEWRPITYAEHFLVTGFRAKELAIHAFENCDPCIRAQFDAACKEVEAGIANVQTKLEQGVDAVQDPSGEAAQLYSMISKVGGVINPNGFGQHGVAVEDDASSEDQSAIDALFD